MEKNHRQIDDIETLRALAIVLTVAVHLPDLFPWWHGPAGLKIYGILNLRVGVDLFFVISGFVIGSSVLDRWSPAVRRGSSVRLLPSGFEGLVSLMRFDPIALGVPLVIWRQHPLYARVEPTFLRNKPLLGGLLVLIVLGLASIALALKVCSLPMASSPPRAAR